jgi:adenylate cyclase
MDAGAVGCPGPGLGAYMANAAPTRRLTTIVAADVAGYSRLTAADEEGTLGALRAHRAGLIDPKIAEYGGRIANTAGDSLLIEFGSVVNALRAVLEIQAGVTARNTAVPRERRIEFRVGINVGDVVAEGEDLLGDGVNVAARLEALAKPGGITLSATAHDQVRDRVEVNFEDLGEVEVKNLPRPVRIFRVLTDGETAPDPRRSGVRRRVAVTVAALLVAIAASAGLWWWQPWIERVDAARPDRFGHALPDRPSIAIMPFANLSNDQRQDYFADGFTEDLITNVAQSKDLFVIARNSTFTYKGRAVRIRQIAEELGVRYVVEGSIRRIGENMRITAQLIDAASGAFVWARRYDEPTSKLFDLQDEIGQEIAGALLVGVGKADLAKASQKRPKDLSAYDHVLRARAQFALASRKTTSRAREFAEQAIIIDPDYAPAYAILGDTFSIAYILQWEGPDALERAYEAALKAVELDPRLSAAHSLLGRIFLRRRQYEDAVATHKKSIALNPNRADSHAFLADTLTFMGRADEAVGSILTAMRLDPFYPVLFDLYLGRAYYFSKQYDKAAARLRTCAVRAPKFRPCYMFLAPTYAELGNQAEARRIVETLREIAPKFSISKSVRKHLPFIPSAMRFYISGLRKAGVPE